MPVHLIPPLKVLRIADLEKSGMKSFSITWWAKPYE